MLHRLFALLSALSLALCVGTCAMWVRSYWVLDELTLHRARYPAAINIQWWGPVSLAQIAEDSIWVNHGTLGLHLKHSVALKLGAQNVKEWSERYPLVGEFGTSEAARTKWNSGSPRTIWTSGFSSTDSDSSTAHAESPASSPP